MRRVGITIMLVVATAAWGMGPAAAVSHPVLKVRPAISAADGGCGLSAGGTVDCWGISQVGELGNNSSTSSGLVPVRVHGVNNVGFLSGVTAISASSVLFAGGACALLAAGTVDCWGDNFYGQLGNGNMTGPAQCSGMSIFGAFTNPCSTTPVQVEGVGGVGVLSGVKAITTGFGDACALLAGGTVDCWGGAPSGSSSVPLPVVGVGGVGVLSGVIAISAGTNDSVCALLSGGTVDCWGNPLGNNSVAFSAVPVQVEGVGGVGFLTHVMSISAGFDGVCAVVAPFRTVDCWGYAEGSGSMGDNSTADALTPVQVHGVGNVGALKGVGAISVGENYACASLATGGTVDCWGNAPTAASLVPVPIHGVGNDHFLKGVTAISAGELDACGLMMAGTVDCWGTFRGDNSTNVSSVPTEVHGLSNHGFLVL